MAQKSTLDPELADRLRALGYTAFAAGEDSQVSDRKLPDPKDRIQVYEAVSEALEDSQRTKDFANAVVEFKKALDLSPTTCWRVFNLGLAHAALGNDEESIKYLKRTLELDPTNFTAAFDLGVAYLHKQMIPVRRQRSRNTHDRRPGA